jgi:hypothetical protein
MKLNSRDVDEVRRGVVRCDKEWLGGTGMDGRGEAGIAMAGSGLAGLVGHGPVRRG